MPYRAPGSSGHSQRQFLSGKPIANYRPRGSAEIRHLVDEDSGVGTQFVVADVNCDGLPDIVTSNKKGVYVLLQQRAGK